MIAFFTLAATALFTLVSAQAPTLNFPLQAQLPPVARVNQYFEWSLLSNTFTSDAVVTYAALDMPSWLAFDANTLTFHGLPTSGDTGNNFVIVQANATGRAVGIQSGFHCLVVNGRGPQVRAPVQAQLTDGEAVISSAYVQSDGSIRIPPSWSFSIGFQYYTISDGDSPVYYTAYRAGTTSLPNWLQFDNETVTFGGLAPANTNNFDIDLYGSDHYGYGDVKQTFSIVIGQHSFILDSPLPTINVTAKDAVVYTIPTSGLILDGQRIRSANLTSVQASIPSNVSYLSYDSGSRTISGTLPSELPSTDNIYIPVTFTDAFNDTILTNVTISITPLLFSQSDLPGVNITGGKYFNAALDTFLISNETSYSAAFDPPTSSSWLTFHNDTKMLDGTPPLDGRNVIVNITAVDAPTGVIESATLTLFYTDGKTNLQNSGKGGLSNGAKIALAVVFGVIGGLLLLVLIMWLCRRYCHHDDQVDDDATLAAMSYEKGKERQTPLSMGRASMGSTDSDRLSQAIAAAEFSVAAAMAQEQKEPRRMDLMRVFGGAKKGGSANNLASVGQSGRSLKEILGMTHSRQEVASPDFRQHQIITVTDGDGYTYRATTPDGTPELVIRNPEHSSDDEGAMMSRTVSNSTRSSFESRGSSSLFYSEEANSNESPVRRPEVAHARESTPKSIPRRRRDFLPYKPPPRKLSAEDTASTSLPAVSPPNGGIRLVQPRRDGSPIADDSYEDHVDALDYNAALAADAALASAQLQHYEEPEPEAAIAMCSYESRPHSKPRLIAFTSEKRGEKSGSPPEKRFSSQKGIHSESGHVSVEHSLEDTVDESTEDSPFDDNVQRYSTVSQPYQPPQLGDRGSPIYFSTSPSSQHTAHQNQPSHQSTRSIAQSSRSRANTTSVYVEPFRIALNAGEPFHFTAQVHPPPMASIGSPGRDG